MNTIQKRVINLAALVDREAPGLIMNYLAQEEPLEEDWDNVAGLFPWSEHPKGYAYWSRINSFSATLSFLSRSRVEEFWEIVHGGEI